MHRKDRVGVWSDVIVDPETTERLTVLNDNGALDYRSAGGGKNEIQCGSPDIDTIDGLGNH